jgi:hypothetical protein
MEKHKEKVCTYAESGSEGGFTVLEFIFCEHVQFRTSIYRVVENFTGYADI